MIQFWAVPIVERNTNTSCSILMRGRELGPNLAFPGITHLARPDFIELSYPLNVEEMIKRNWEENSKTRLLSLEYMTSLHPSVGTMLLLYWAVIDGSVSGYEWFTVQELQTIQWTAVLKMYSAISAEIIKRRCHGNDY